MSNRPNEEIFICQINHKYCINKRPLLTKLGNLDLSIIIVSISQDVRVREVDMEVVQQMSGHFGVSLSEMHPLIVNVSMSVCQYVSMSVCQYVSMSVCQYVSMSVCQYVSMSVCQYVSMSVCHYVSMSVCQYVSMSVCQYVILTY